MCVPCEVKKIPRYLIDARLYKKLFQFSFFKGVKIDKAKIEFS
jgi:hypothetical protein